MAKITIKDVPPFDGTYDLNVGALNGRELHLIKQVSGVRAGELVEAMTAGDYDLVIAFTVIVLRRAGIEVEPEQILEAAVGAISVNLDDERKVEERDPNSLPPAGSENSDGDKNAQSERNETSGSPSNGSGDHPPSLPIRTGSPGSEIFADSAPETLAT